MVTTPVTSFTSLNYQQAACFSSAVGLRQSRLIRADDFLDVESCIPESFRNLDDQLGVSGSVRKDSGVDPSGDMM